MKNKYYLPKIEEFHIGFEYEFKYKISGWTSNTYNIRNGVGTHHTLEFIEKSINNNIVRVKRLSKECIASLGYEVKIVDCGQDTEDYPDIFLNGSSIGEFHIHDKMNIRLFNNYYSIKNKSELKKLMNQLNINNEN